jgi:putative solute:sodium symporter small subunit
MSKRTYWQDNLRLVSFCLVIWFLVSFGCGILFRDWLDQIEVGGVRLGFWFAQQGSIYVFVALIFFYAWRMSAVDKRHGLDED